MSGDLTRYGNAGNGTGPQRGNGSGPMADVSTLYTGLLMDPRGDVSEVHTSLLSLDTPSVATVRYQVLRQHMQEFGAAAQAGGRAASGDSAGGATGAGLHPAVPRLAAPADALAGRAHAARAAQRSADGAVGGAGAHAPPVPATRRGGALARGCDHARAERRRGTGVGRRPLAAERPLAPGTHQQNRQNCT